MPANDVWGNSWADSWGVSWAQSVEPPVVVTSNKGGGAWTEEDLRALRKMERAAEKVRDEGLKRDRRLDRQRTKELEAIYDRAMGLEAPIVEKVADIVRPAAKTEAAQPTAQQIDWTIVLAQAETLARLIEVFEGIKEPEDDFEDELLLTMVLV